MKVTTRSLFGSAFGIGNLHEISSSAEIKILQFKAKISETDACDINVNSLLPSDAVRKHKILF